MRLRPKNWDSFQHYKDRRPAWIKLHHELVDNVKFHALKGEDGKYLVMIWLIASEDFGYLPPLTELAFRLRISEKQTEQLLSRLQSWFIYDASKPDSNPIEEAAQAATPEKSKSKNAEKELEGEARAPRDTPATTSRLGSDAEEENTIPDDLPALPLGNFLLQRLSIPRSMGLSVHFADAVDLLARDEQLPRGKAAKLLLDRARGHPPENGKWRFWLDDGQWKAGAGKDEYQRYLEQTS